MSKDKIKKAARLSESELEFFITKKGLQLELRSFSKSKKVKEQMRYAKELAGMT